MNFELIASYAVKIAFAVISGLVTMYVIPWLKERRLYDTVKRMVQAAEKYAQNNAINKKAYVIEKLREKGIEVNSVVDAMIESAVEELDIAIGKA